jgi:dTDP-4-amino-4,6-dideoxygalactose transaminase
MGTCGCFSFYPSKNLGALGDGGAIVTDDAALAEKLRRLRQYGWERKYYTVEPGGANSRLDELQAAFLSAKLQHLTTWNNARRRWAGLYNKLLADLPLVLPTDPTGGHVYHLYVLQSAQRDALQAALREQGIGTDVHYPVPAHLQPVYARHAPPGGLPVTERLAREVVSLPLYPELTQIEVETVAQAVREALR